MKLILLTALFSYQALAYLPDEIASRSCRAQLEKTLMKNGSKDRWIRSDESHDRVEIYRSPTKKPGTWVEVQTQENPRLAFYSAEKTRVYQFSGKDCSVIINSDFPAPDFIKKKGKGFSDQDLAKIVSQDKPTMIYIWSPDESSSMSEFQSYQKIAQDLGADFLPLLDMNKNPAEAVKLASGHQINVNSVRMKSIELYMRDGNLNFPAMFVVGYGKFSPRIFGVLTSVQLLHKLENEIAVLKRTTRD